MFSIKCVFVVIASLLSIVNSANVLGVFLFPSISHQLMFQSIWKELSLRGHQVTILTPNILNDTMLTNLTEIDLKESYQILDSLKFLDHMAKDNNQFLNLYKIFSCANDMNDLIFNLPNMQRFIKNDSQNFDLILVESLMPMGFAFGAKRQVPIIGVSSLGAALHSHDAMGNPTHPVLSPDILLNIVGTPTFNDRLQSVLYNVWYRLLYNYYFLPKADKLARKYFGEDIPFLGDIERNMSLLLLNVNPILHPIRPNVPSIIELRQMHIKPKKPLPQDLQAYLDSSTEGVIYFSLGSNVKSVNLTENVRSTIIGALAELPFKVLWKWETDHLPNQPSNVITRKWLPQQDVLGHKNIKAFVTQGGIQSMEEAVTNSVPMIGMPFFGDQPLNVAKMVQIGIAKMIDSTTMTKDELKSTIMEVATNPKFKNNIEKVRALLVDEPMTGVEKAMWWIEYVLRHKGASHLKSPAVDMVWYEYFVLDVVLFIAAVIILIVYLMYFITTLLLRRQKHHNKLKSQ